MNLLINSTFHSRIADALTEKQPVFTNDHINIELSKAENVFALIISDKETDRNLILLDATGAEVIATLMALSDWPDLADQVGQIISKAKTFVI